MFKKLLNWLFENPVSDDDFFKKGWESSGDDGTLDNYYLKTQTFEDGRPFKSN